MILQGSSIVRVVEGERSVTFGIEFTGFEGRYSDVDDDEEKEGGDRREGESNAAKTEARLESLEGGTTGGSEPVVEDEAGGNA